jgi:hypothetical protein
MKIAPYGVAIGAAILCLTATPAMAAGAQVTGARVADTQVVVKPTVVSPGQQVRVIARCPSLGYDSYTLSVDGKVWNTGRLIRGSGTGIGTAPKRRGGHRISGRCLPCPGSVASAVGIRGTVFTVDEPAAKPKHRYPRGGVNTGFGGTSAEAGHPALQIFGVGTMLTAAPAGHHHARKAAR